VRVAVVGHGEAVDRVVAILEADERFDREPATAADAERALRTGRAALIVVPVLEGDSVALTCRYDPTRPEGRSAWLDVDRAVQRALGRRDVATVREEHTTASGGRYIDFLIPGLIGLNIMSSSMWGIGYNVVHERRRRLLRRLAATPMRRSHYLLSHMLSRLLFLVLEVGLLLLFGRVVFGVVIHGSVLGVGVLSVAGAFSFMGIAMCIAARPDNTEVAAGWMNAVMLPMWLLSGSFFSYQRFPEFVHPVIRALPLTAFNDAMRAIVNEGAAAWTTWPQILVLAAWGVLGFVVSMRLFRWQ
jgi:ABC-type multidrug transport system permease subunit